MSALTPPDESQRLAALRQCHILDTPAEDAFDDLTRLAAQVCGVPIAAVSLVDEERQWFKSIVGLPITETPREQAFCAHAILQPETMVVPDATQDERFHDNPLVTGQPDIRFYAGAPLVTSDGYALGSLCVIDRVPRVLTEQQKAVLEVLARQVAGRIEMQKRVTVHEHLLAEQERLMGEREEARRRLEESEQHYRSLFDHHPHAVFSFDLAGRFVSANAACQTLSGFAPAELIGGTFSTLIPAEQYARVLGYFVLATQGQSQNFQTCLVHMDGHTVPIAVTAIPIVVNHNVVGVYGVAENITARVEAEAALRESHEHLTESEQHLRLALESGGLGSYLLDVPTAQFLVLSDTCTSHFALPADARVSRAEFLALLHPDDRDAAQEAYLRALRGGDDYAAEYRTIWPDGSEHWISARGRLLTDESGAATRMVGVTQEITEHKRAEAQHRQELHDAQERADRDPLTGLWNHRAFHRRLEEEAARAARTGNTAAVVILDLDNFKFFNDCYGHAQGDQVLSRVAERLLAVCRPYDTVARFGGDEFALLLPAAGVATPAEIEARLRADLSSLSFRPEGLKTAIPLGVTTGVALLSPLGVDRQEALQQADERLRRAKTGGAVDTEADQVRAAAQGSVAGFPMLDALVTAVDNKDRYTRRHSEDVMAYCLMIARELGMDEGEQHTVAVAALLHDVGKIGVPDAVLRKPGALAEAEVAAVRQHPQMGAAIVGTVPGLEGTLDAVRHHHERWDGGGYPGGLAGDAIPFIARLMAVADAFSAMTTDRPYRKGMDTAEAVSLLEEGIAIQWDPMCVGAFLRALEKPHLITNAG